MRGKATVTEKEHLYKIGEKVVYPAHGVGVIDSIETRHLGVGDQKFYKLTILESGMKIMVPVSQADVVGLRRVVDTKTIEKVYEILRERNVVINTQTWNRRYREYTQKIKTGSVFEIAKVIRDLSVLRGDKELSFGERKMLDTAQGLLVKEISIAKARSEDAIKAELEALCARMH
ncbi:MAG: CarD family transcriptional regulator [Deltaproteobacteria bacterium]|nr:CarD family transcriptional regulator [Deltaproteobacteria bacterium]